MTNLVKCTGCNLIVDELLCYVQQKISIADEETLVRICASAFTGDEIKKSKTLLYEALPTDKRKVIRKNKGKEERDLSDIISLLKSTEPDDIPVFVARQLDKLPPILWDHLDCSKVLKDILKMKTEIENIKINYATTDSVQDLKVEVMRIRNISHSPQYRNLGVNKEKRCDYGEETQEWQLSRATQSKQARAGIAGGQSLSPQQAPAPATAPEPAPAVPMSQLCAARAGTTNASLTSSVLGPAAAATPQVFNQLTEAVMDHRELKLCGQPINGMNDTMLNLNNDDGVDGWQRVSHRKQKVKYRFVGKSGIAKDMQCSFKAAEKKIPMFITNVHMSTKECDIVQYIQKRTEETVSLEVINMRVPRGYKAFKFYILECNLPTYMDEKLWPAGVIFRRFVSYRRNDKKQENNPAGGTNKPNNG